MAARARAAVIEPLSRVMTTSRAAMSLRVMVSTGMACSGLK